ncbi:MAG: spermidine synthase [Actinobacteria bacterium]|nr:spermidine synthase [Actinomycetota bacterium]
MQAVEEAPARGEERGAMPGDRGRLAVASFLMLFVELALIRGTVVNIVYLSFFTNVVLLASFLGIGMGFLRAGRFADRFRWAPASLAALVVFVLVFTVRIGPKIAGVPKLIGLGGSPPMPEWLSVPLVFLAVVVVMAAIAGRVALLFQRFAPLEAYRLDVLGSIAGIVAFSALSFVGADPLSWALVIAATFVYLLRGELTRLVAWSLVVLVALGAGISLAPRDAWSPYQRVSRQVPTSDGKISIFVNNRRHQTIAPLDVLLSQQPYYGYPYSHLQRDLPGDVLIVGAGSGNDVALALQKGATHVDAVEIDPVLQRLGYQLHPNHPYQDPRVSVHIDDGRAFLERTDQTYDRILFALPDSLTLVSGQAGLRLESYLFTVEAMRSVLDHLRPDGVFAMYNYYRPDVIERYATTLTEVFGHAPCLDRGEPGAGTRTQAVLTISREPDGISCSTPWVQIGPAPEPATDDHPFPYLPGRSIPGYYLVALALVLLSSVVLVRRGAGRPMRDMRPYADLFFMGAAFLLLETKSVVQFALLFGTTWFVNSLVFAGILLSVLAAVEVARRARLPRPVLLFGALLVALAVAWAVHPESLLSLAVAPRFAAASALAFAPVFLANLIFAQRFRDVGASTVAFGANLLGAMVGGVLEYGALIVGYRALLVGVAMIYMLAYLTRARSPETGAVAA